MVKSEKAVPKAVPAVTDDTQSEWSRLKAIDGAKRDQRVVEFDRAQTKLQRRKRLDHVERAIDEHKAGAATPGTVRHFRSCVVAKLWIKGTLSDEHKQAADEIARVYQALVVSLVAKTMRFGGPVGGTPPQEWAPSLKRAYTERYAPWRDATGGKQLRHGYSLQALVIDVVVENRGVRQVANQIGADQRWVIRQLQEGLYAYCELSGWVSGNAPLLSRIAESEAEKAA